MVRKIGSPTEEDVSAGPETEKTNPYVEEVSVSSAARVHQKKKRFLHLFKRQLDWSSWIAQWRVGRGCPTRAMASWTWASWLLYSQLV